MLLHQKLSDRLVPSFCRVHKGLGPGLLESVYEEAMVIELDHLGIPFERQKEYPVFYRLKPAGVYVADLVVDGKIVLELKAVRKLDGIHEAQLLNYLALSGLSVGYLVNFRNPVLERKRLVL